MKRTATCIRRALVPSGEALGGAAVADVRDAVGQHRLQNAACVYAVGSRLDAGIVNRVEGVEGFKREVGLHPLAERKAARDAGIHVVGLVDVEIADRPERNAVPAAGTVERAVGQRRRQGTRRRRGARARSWLPTPDGRLARVVMPESSQPFTKYLAKVEVLLVKVGLQSQLMERRWR